MSYSDGINTAVDETDDAFTVERKPPEAAIIYPLDGSAFLPGGLVVLDGTGTDLEDGPLTDDALFTWYSSLEGELGQGRKLYYDDQPRGWHTITLQVADSDGFVSEDSVSILIGARLRLPLVFREN